MKSGEGRMAESLVPPYQMHHCYDTYLSGKMCLLPVPDGIAVSNPDGHIAGRSYRSVVGEDPSGHWRTMVPDIR
jgi:hypothetical protein